MYLMPCENGLSDEISLAKEQCIDGIGTNLITCPLPDRIVAALLAATQLVLWNSFIFIPYLGRNVIAGSILIRWPEARRIFHLCDMVAMISVPSIHAKGSPIQPLIPPPNGK